MLVGIGEALPVSVSLLKGLLNGGLASVATAGRSRISYAAKSGSEPPPKTALMRFARAVWTADSEITKLYEVAFAGPATTPRSASASSMVLWARLTSVCLDTSSIMVGGWADPSQ